MDGPSKERKTDGTRTDAEQNVHKINQASLHISPSRWLYLDDVRTPIEERFDIVRTYREFVDYIETNGIPELVSFDHDLAHEHIRHYFNNNGDLKDSDYEYFKEKTGYDCARFLVEFSKRTGQEIQKVFVHSHNPVGATRIRDCIVNYKKSLDLEVDEWDVWRYEPPYVIEPGMRTILSLYDRED